MCSRISGEATILEVAYNSRREERRPDNVKVQEQEERLKKMTKDKEKLQRQLDRLVVCSTANSLIHEFTKLLMNSQTHSFMHSRPSK